MKSKKPLKKKKKEVNTATNKVLRNRPNFLAQSVLIDARITGLGAIFHTPNEHIDYSSKRLCFMFNLPETQFLFLFEFSLNLQLPAACSAKRY